MATTTKTFGFPALFALESVLCGVAIMLLNSAFNSAAHQEHKEATGAAPAGGGKPNTGLLEGIRLVGRHRYVLAIAVISTFSEVVGTIMDYEMKVKAKAEYSTPEEFSSFMGYFGQGVNGVSLIFALTGSKALIRVFGLRFCLLAFPCTCAVLIGVIFLYPNLWVLFVGMISLKALGYSLNNPSKEMLYLQTSKDIKFKAKSWIDMFGTRAAKAVGSVCNNVAKGSVDSLLMYGSITSWSFVGVWIYFAQTLGVSYYQLLARGEIVS